jgi:nucleotide-binding universal stress UspA family protein
VAGTRDASGMSKPIIAAVDPRSEDVAPAALGALLARLTGAPLVLAATYSVDLSVDNLYPDYARALQVETEQALRRVAATAEAAGVPVATRAVPADDSPARALRELAEETGAKFLVIGSSARGPIGRLLPTAVTDRLLHGAPCPVAVAPAGFSFEDAAAGPGSIGVAFTDTPDGHAALATARALAAPAHAQLRVVTVAPPLDPLVTGSLADSRPVDVLAEASEALGLLVCGSRGYGPLRTLLLGGTSHTLVRKAACGVLVVPPGTKEREYAVSAAQHLERRSP